MEEFDLVLLVFRRMDEFSKNLAKDRSHAEKQVFAVELLELAQKFGIEDDDKLNYEHMKQRMMDAKEPDENSFYVFGSLDEIIMDEIMEVLSTVLTLEPTLLAAAIQLNHCESAYEFVSGERPLQTVKTMLTDRGSNYRNLADYASTLWKQVAIEIRDKLLAKVVVDKEYCAQKYQWVDGQPELKKKLANKTFGYLFRFKTTTFLTKIFILY